MGTEHQIHLNKISWDFDPRWSLSTAHHLATQLEVNWDNTIELLVLTTREFFHEYDHSPNSRVLVKFLKNKIDPAISSMTLQVALKGNPALVLAYLSGIPKPKQCF